MISEGVIRAEVWAGVISEDMIRAEFRQLCWE